MKGKRKGKREGKKKEPPRELVMKYITLKAIRKQGRSWMGEHGHVWAVGVVLRTDMSPKPPPPGKISLGKAEKARESQNHHFKSQFSEFVIIFLDKFEISEKWLFFHGYRNEWASWIPKSTAVCHPPDLWGWPHLPTPHSGHLGALRPVWGRARLSVMMEPLYCWHCSQDGPVWSACARSCKR